MQLTSIQTYDEVETETIVDREFTVSVSGGSEKFQLDGNGVPETDSIGTDAVASFRAHIRQTGTRYGWTIEYKYTDYDPISGTWLYDIDGRPSQTPFDETFWDSADVSTESTYSNDDDPEFAMDDPAWDFHDDGSFVYQQDYSKNPDGEDDVFHATVHVTATVDYKGLSIPPKPASGTITVNLVAFQVLELVSVTNQQVDLLHISTDSADNIAVTLCQPDAVEVRVDIPGSMPFSPGQYKIDLSSNDGLMIFADAACTNLLSDYVLDSPTETRTVYVVATNAGEYSLHAKIHPADGVGGALLAQKTVKEKFAEAMADVQDKIRSGISDGVKSGLKSEAKQGLDRLFDPLRTGYPIATRFEPAGRRRRSIE